MHEWAVDRKLFEYFRTTDGIAAFVFAGHGANSRYGTGESNSGSVAAWAIEILYKLQALYGYIC